MSVEKWLCSFWDILFRPNYYSVSSWSQIIPLYIIIVTMKVMIIIKHYRSSTVVCLFEIQLSAKGDTRGNSRRFLDFDTLALRPQYLRIKDGQEFDIWSPDQSFISGYFRIKNEKFDFFYGKSSVWCRLKWWIEWNMCIETVFWPLYRVPWWPLPISRRSVIWSGASKSF